MTLIKSISGIRGTIGGKNGDNLTPPDILAFSAGFATWLNQKFSKPKILVGRDGRNSGAMVQSLVQATLVSLGIEVIDVGLNTTPSLAMGIILQKAQGGIMITASHNPMEWNALKFMNQNGEFINKSDGAEVLELADSPIQYNTYDRLGSITYYAHCIADHIHSILDLPLVNCTAIKNKRFKVVVDAINSSGAISIPPLLERLGVDAIVINGDINGKFNHNPEPLPEHLHQIQQAVLDHQADLGIIVDPDVDRLAFVSEDGIPFGEEYTLVAVADYILKHTKGNTVSNLSSTLALRDITQMYNGTYYPSAVGELNVVVKMKEVNAVIGGEGNGGVIYPDLHYGRDAMVGIALFLSHLANENCTASALKNKYPQYEMSKNKIEIIDKNKIETIIQKVKEEYHRYDINTVDGVKILMDNEWIHLRQSNTEPIIRIYAESATKERADTLALQMMHFIDSVQKKLS